MRKLYIIAAVLLLAGCSQREWTYENKAFISGERVVSTILKGSLRTSEAELACSMPRPEQNDVRINFSVDGSLVADYNRDFYDDAVILPEENWSLSSTSTEILAGTVESLPVTVTFSDLNRLPTDRVYVLPVAISSPDIPLLNSASMRYFVFRAGSLINVVADLEKSNYIVFDTFESDAASAAPFKTISDWTLEALVNIREFQPGIQTVMGQEGNLLIRISDVGLQPNQLQVVTPSGNLPASGVSEDVCALTPGEWTHIAVTGNAATGEVIIYFNGVEEYRRTLTPWGTIDLVTGRTSARDVQYFRIGYSYEAGREMDGMVSECRIWNKVRTQEEISENMYEADPSSDGLLGYWKFDEGSGDVINDRTGLGNNGRARYGGLLWVPVSLPNVNE